MMRISTLTEDVGFTSKSYKYLPYLNGKAITNAVTADEELGYVLRYIESEDEDFRILRDLNNMYKIEFGEVEIRPNDEF